MLGRVSIPTKAEILLTRGCNLQCSYCSMVQYKSLGASEWKARNELSDEQWGQVPAKLAELDIPFAAIYGAEPLTRLPALLSFISNATFPCTVITNGLLLDKKPIKALSSAGLKSITLSDDIISSDKQVTTKSSRARRLLADCLEVFEDVELIVTLTPQNLPLLVDYIMSMPKGVYVHFDFQHHDRGQEGSKCSGETPAFQTIHAELIRDSMKSVLLLKQQGCRVHPSEKVLRELVKNPLLALNLNWKCEAGAWVTVNSDGDVYGCDDYQPNSFRGRNILDYSEKWSWSDWVKEWGVALKKCPGCFWITHAMAVDFSRSQDKEWHHELTHK